MPTESRSRAVRTRVKVSPIGAQDSRDSRAGEDPPTYGMRCAVLRAVLALSLSTVAGAQSPEGLPFGAGERLYFTVRSKVGTVGRAVMTLARTQDQNGFTTLLATFTTRIRVAFLKGSTVGRSSIDPVRMASVRYVEDEHRPFSSARDSVEIDPAGQRWAGLSDSGATATDKPLDELSFIYFLRTVDLAPDSLYSYDRFYDKRRTPTTVRLVRRDTLRAPFGNVGVFVLDMNVKDRIDRGGDKTIRLWLSDDPCRVPLRIETKLPYLGAAVMTIDSASTPECAPREPRTVAAALPPVAP